MRTVLAALLVATAAAGCGGEDPSAAPATAKPQASEAVTAAGDCMDATAAEGAADLEMQDNVFAPPCLQMSASQGLRIHNEGQSTHNFSVEGFGGLDVDVSPGQENNTEATGLRAGTYTFFCEYHRQSDDMEGRLVVVA